MYDPVDHGLTDIREARELPQLRTTFASHLMRRHAIVAAEIRYLLVDEHVASDFAKDRRTMSSKLLGDDLDAEASRSPASNLTAFVQSNLRVGASQRVFLATDNPLVSFASRTSSLNPTRRGADRDAPLGAAAVPHCRSCTLRALSCHATTRDRISPRVQRGWNPNPALDLTTTHNLPVSDGHREATRLQSGGRPDRQQMAHRKRYFSVFCGPRQSCVLGKHTNARSPPSARFDSVSRPL